MPRFLAPLAAGLFLGATAIWFIPRPAAHSASDPLATRDPLLANSAPPPWSWRDSATPPPLATDSAASAIAAWHALRAPDGAPADFPTRVDALRTLLVHLRADALPRLLAPLGGAKLSEDDRALREIAFSAWIETDPAAAAAWAAAGPDRLDLARQALSVWSALDPRAAAAWACALRDESTALRLAALALPELAKLDSAQAVALASSRGDAFLDALLPGLLKTLAKSDPASVLRAYGPRLWKNGDGFWGLREVLADWTARDPSAALAWIVAQPARDNRRLSRWLGELAVDDSQRGALATALATTPGVPSRQSTLGQMLFRWSAEKPAEALAWLDTLSDPHLRAMLLERAANSTFPDHPEQSLPLALAMPEGANRTQRLGHLLGQWAGKDASAALAWLRENTSTPGVAAASDDVHSTILATIARDEPATAVAEWQALPAGPLKTKAIAHITLAWGQTDPAAALQWAAEQAAQTPGAISYQAGELVFAWARKDGPAALRWAESISNDHARHRALNALAGNWQDKAPRAATADLYAQIKDPALRTQFVTDHVREWLTMDPASAKTWLESHDALTPAQAAALVAPAK